jgi:hypothetical protein
MRPDVAAKMISVTDNPNRVTPPLHRPMSAGHLIGVERRQSQRTPRSRRSTAAFVPDGDVELGGQH